MSISKTLRFEVFKRDVFKCQYCGRTPPSVSLELDHIKPKIKKGKDNINNLVTSCFDCNRGKGKVLLKMIPSTLLTNLETLKEKEMQLKEYNKFLAKIERRVQKEMDEIDDIYSSYFSKYSLSEKFRNSSLKNFLHLLPKQTLIDAMNQACYKMIDTNKANSEDKAIKYFCGICWAKIKGLKETFNNG